MQQDTPQTPTPQSTQTVQAPDTPAAPVSSTPNQNTLEHIIPINRSVWAIIAGYVALFSILMFPAPIAVILGVIALQDLKKKPTLKGKGRAWFAIIFGGLMTLFLLFLVVT
jgi:hypothetical protein